MGWNLKANELSSDWQLWSSNEEARSRLVQLSASEDLSWRCWCRMCWIGAHLHSTITHPRRCSCVHTSLHTTCHPRLTTVWNRALSQNSRWYESEFGVIQNAQGCMCCLFSAAYREIWLLLLSKISLRPCLSAMPRHQMKIRNRQNNTK